MKKNLFFTLLYSLLLISLPAQAETIENDTPVIEQQSSTKSKLYPNPARDYIQIKNSSSLPIKNISILSMVGSSMLNKDLGNQLEEQPINVSRLPSGRYFVKISYHNGSQEILNLIKI
ncbi:T9SS type A sorting domain-containing protein [Apibacter muscae]|uniref:T9SS type A sorting domain-containing protein n=1 Tax=Apibacter muscae TaxID=2509004 RepID=A0A563DHI9_9FLAO|nr:T9SS type A sorting domain-containing protein [Apibacter muscae]TWP24691.1 T9SS type A sorting domain-containing protein [Apibacter muscae]TWP29746.1 T9SS type A sorting domain-containing protein [Apibacter muscae]TWP30893.1 T9SS type A sorting domain-containing protein [Apibacter muscae]